MKKITILTALCFFGLAVYGAGPSAISNAPSAVQNMRVVKLDTKIYVTYDLTVQTDIEVYVSVNNGINYTGPIGTASGEVGKGINPGKNKTIVWDAAQESGYENYSNMIIKIVASSVPVEEESKFTSASTPSKNKPVVKTSSGDKPVAKTPSKGYSSPKQTQWGLEFSTAPITLILTEGETMAIDIGFRYTKNYSSNRNFCIGWDMLKLKFTYYDSYESWGNGSRSENMYSFQLLSGVTANTGYLGRSKINFYSSLRIALGYVDYYSSEYYRYTSGYNYYSGATYSYNDFYDDYDGLSVGLEWELGVRFNRFFLGTTVYGIYGTFATGLRLGWNF